jgi:hypothetical protein
MCNNIPHFFHHLKVRKTSSGLEAVFLKSRHYHLFIYFQWAGEVISSREKTTVPEEFLDLEKDIELRRDGVDRSVVWCPALSS